MSTVTIINNAQDNVHTIDGVTLTIKNGENEIPVAFWFGFKYSNNGKRKIDRGTIHPKDVSAESDAISDFKVLYFSELNLLGAPAVKASLNSGSMPEGVKHSLAKEWLESKSETLELNRENREEEALSISRKALRNSERANTIAIIAIVCSVITAAIAIYFK